MSLVGLDYLLPLCFQRCQIHRKGEGAVILTFLNFLLSQVAHHGENYIVE